MSCKVQGFNSNLDLFLVNIGFWNLEKLIWKNDSSSDSLKFFDKFRKSENTMIQSVFHSIKSFIQAEAKSRKIMKN